MGALSRQISKFCYNHPNFGIPGLMKYIAISNLVVYALDLLTNNMATMMLSLYPSYVMSGQVWRLFTFVMVPEPSSFVLWFLISTFFYYWLGTTLEQRWGSGQFTLYYGLSVVMMIVLSMATGYAGSMYYVNLSLFFAFATLFPEMQVNLYGIIPLKIKWMGWLYAAFYVIGIIQSIFEGYWIGVIYPLVAILNYFIFFWDALTGTALKKKQQVQYRNSPQVKNFKKAQQEIKNRKGYLHKCTVCGVTDEQNPNMEFRYCSKCEGYHCYCINHINNHDHIQ